MTSSRKSLRVLIGGGSGFIGKELSSVLRNAGHEVTLISRTNRNGSLSWDQVSDPAFVIPETDAVVNLSGANIMGSLLWTSSFQQELISSRVNTTKSLASAIIGKRFKGGPPRVFVAGSAIGAYPSGVPGPTVDEDFSDYPQTFFGQLVKKWEEAATLPQDAETRLVRVRTGVVFGKEGALKSMTPSFKLGVATVAGTGTQYFPWIHLHDIVGIFNHAIQNDNVTGVLNGVAPEASTALDVTHAISRAMGGSFVTVHTPAPALKLMLGPERAAMLLEGHKVVPKRTLESGYKFKYTSLDAAIRDALS